VPAPPTQPPHTEPHLLQWPTTTRPCCCFPSTTRQVLLAARTRAPGARAQGPDSALRERDRAHFFLRVVVHRGGAGADAVSHLHLVDLIGTAPMDDAPHSVSSGNSNSNSSSSVGAWRHLPEEDRVARRDHALQLQALTKVRWRQVVWCGRPHFSPSPTFLALSPQVLAEMKHLAAAGAGAGAGGRQSSPLLLAPAAAGAKVRSEVLCRPP